MDSPFLGAIFMSGITFAPRGYALCDGQLLSIAQNTALFSILGTTYGGNGVSTFALPDLRGRVPVHAGAGAGPGLSQVQLGEASGVEAVTLLSTEMPQHTHTVAAASGLACSSAVGTSSNPSGAFPAVSSRPMYAEAATGGLGVGFSAVAGGNQAHNNRQPCATLNFFIALQGIFPSRN